MLSNQIISNRFPIILWSIGIVATGCIESKSVSDAERDTSTRKDSGADRATESDFEDTGDIFSDGGNQCLNPDGEDTNTASETESTSDTRHNDTETETSSNTEKTVGTESETASETTTETATGTGTNSTDVEPETEMETDTSTVVEEKCPEDMVFVPDSVTSDVPHAFCIDRYEASRVDATSTSGGSDESMAVSKKGVIPWYVNPMTENALAAFENGCINAGKRMCEREEWFASCTGSEASTYVFGNTFSPEICNCVDTYCDDYCDANGISEEECNLLPNCGYSCGGSSGTTACFHVDPTGSFEGCTNSFGTYDISGNVWEIVPSTEDARGYEVRGGAFNCASASARLQCNYNASWVDLYAGFRCCKDPA
jgi:hypothetical protein